MESLVSFFKQFCNPCPRIYTEAVERKLQLKRNEKFLSMQFTMVVMISLFILFIKENPNFTDYWFLGAFILNIIVFMLIANRHPRLYKYFYATTLTLAGPLALYLHKDGIFACWATVSLAPTLLLYFSGCRRMYITQVVVQLCYMALYYKDKMIDALNERTSEAFVADLMACQMFAIIFSSVIIYGIGVSLVDNFKQEVVAGESQRKELEVQKTFILSFSHEIRNLINTLTGNIQLSLLEKPCPKIKGYLEDAEVGAGLLIQLVNNILDTGNIDVGEIDINRSNQMIHSTLEKAWRMCAYLLKAKNLKGKFRITKNLPRNLLLDHDRFMQIFINLIVNAVKFTDKGSVDVELDWIPNVTSVKEDCFYPCPFDDEDEGIFEKTQAFSILADNFTVVGLDKRKWSSDRYDRSEGTGPGLLKVTVTDTGYGVAPENLNKVFDRFSSQIFGDGANNRLGTTIGLYVTKELCHMMGGDIKIFSKVEKGTSFIACIPAEQVLSDKMLLRTRSTASTWVLPEEKKLRAMIVDDLSFNIVVLSSYLQRMRMDVANTALDGLDAFNKYVESVRSGNKFDMITMDVEMPIMDGKEAARKIRQFERENNLDPCFLVMISGNVTESEISQCLKHDGHTLANHFLKKPAIYDDVFRIVNEHFFLTTQSSVTSLF